MLEAAIIGGGPAGVAAAISLRQLMRNSAIAIFDIHRNRIWKPGETLSPAARPLLESLGCWPALQAAFSQGAALDSFGTKAAWGAAQLYERDFLYSLHGNGWRLDRAHFDALFLDCAERAGIEVHREVELRDSAWKEGCWRLRLKGKDTTRPMECGAKFVIDASGRSARFAMQRGARPICSDHLVGVFMLFAMPTENAAMEVLVEAAENGWWYSTTVPSNIAVGGWMSDADLVREMGLKSEKRWQELLAQSEHTLQRLQGATVQQAPMIFDARSQILNAVSGRGWAAAGDAAMTFDPLSSHGISKALRSGKMASFVAADFLLHNAETHERYGNLARAEYAEYERTRRNYYREEQRWPTAKFWQRRHSGTSTS
jgi:flavin-dependent dehydrogenase